VGFDPAKRWAADLAVTGRQPEAHAARSVVAGTWIAALVASLGLALRAGGASLPTAVIAAAAAVGMAAGPVIAWVVLRAEATERREELLADLCTYGDLVVLLLAAGAGIESALTSAADAGDGWTWRHLRDELRRARLTRQSPAEVLADLGRDLGVVELEELAAAVALASTSGSRLRASLTARAEALRNRELARIQADAASATEQMTFPVVALAVGFLIVVGFPAITKVLSGF
jgi:Flp pilus assembly protein TadB